MRILSSPYCCRNNRGQAIVSVLIFIGIAALSIAAISRIALWRLDATIALIKQQRIISDWETKRTEIIKSSLPTNSFKRVNIQSNLLAIPVIPKKDLPIESLRVPVFNIGETDDPLFSWDRFLTNNPGTCIKWDGKLCNEIQLVEQKSFVSGDIKLASLTLKTGLNVIASTGDILIDSLILEDGVNLELVAAFNIEIKELIHGPGSKVFLKAIRGHIKLPSIESLECMDDFQLKTSSIHSIQLKNKVLKSSGCSTVSLSDYWQSLRFLGDLSQKTLNSTK